MGHIILGYHQQAAGVLVQPVHDTGPLHATDAAEAVHGVQEGIHQSTAFVASRRMHHHAAGLVHHGHILILVEDINGDVFLLHSGFHRIRDGESHMVTGLYGKPSLGNGFTVHLTQSVTDPLGSLRAAGVTFQRYQHIQPHINDRRFLDLLHSSLSNPAGGTTG